VPSHSPSQASPPPPRISQKYRIIEEDGICGVGERLMPGDVLVNKMTPTNTRDDAHGDPHALPSSAFRPTPLTYKARHACPACFMSAPAVGFLVVRSVSSSGDFEVFERQARLRIRRFQNLLKTRARGNKKT
jgi:hypothetical protein